MAKQDRPKSQKPSAGKQLPAKKQAQGGLPGKSGAQIDQFRLMVEAVVDYALYMLDPDGIVTSWNPGARRFKGYEASEIIGQHFSRFYPEEDRTAGLPARVLEISKRTSKFEGEG